VVATQCSCSAALFKTATQYNVILFSVTKMFCGSFTESLPRQVPHLPQYSYGLEQSKRKQTDARTVNHIPLTHDGGGKRLLHILLNEDTEELDHC